MPTGIGTSGRRRSARRAPTACYRVEQAAGAASPAVVALGPRFQSPSSPGASKGGMCYGQIIGLVALKTVREMPVTTTLMTLYTPKYIRF